ncbi:MAG: thioredoxin domain-containing protein [Candidatus Cohnella colombiensis]|uniref:Thioredoxin n=1 Tax=Candidatus Cohnella colombiensis TaxID=3121368 RepID=A0AA95EYJ3_9BACL|nr:MAG: thioredoxin domain-containing protein [Cohnella sp.]
MLTVNDRTFQESIRTVGVTLVDFSTPWCPPCKVLKPILNEIADAYGEKLAVLDVNCDESPEIAGEYGIMSNPTVIIFHDRQPVEKLVGLRPKTVYESLLSKYL